VDERTVNKLEFNRIREMLRDCCGSALGKELAADLMPVQDPSLIGMWQEETTEGKEILRFNPNFSLGGIRDIRARVLQAGLGGILEPEDFLDVAGTCAASRKAKLFLAGLKGAYPRITGMGRDLGIFKSIETAVGESITPEGGVADTASDSLFNIRRKIRTAQSRIREKLESYIRNPATAKYLQDNLVTIRGNRYVIPVKQEYRSQVPGMIHDQSASGATLFIEPLTVMELNNDLKKLHAAEEEEIVRILKNLSTLIASYEADLLATLEILARLDFIFAKALLSQKMDGCAPQVNNNGFIRLVRARHPLIAGNVVPISLELGQKYSIMVITGPNTGGKTVSLKTTGLLTMMGLAGLHLPADTGTQISTFKHIFADIGDEQSIEQSLSTFSSHLVNIVRILRQANSRTLVLLDELGAGTDPTEGAALAMAIIEYLQSVGVKMIATTHYSELKAFAYNRPGLINASVEFDVATLRPTYRLLIGIPGKSNAFEIARGLGLADEIISQAAAHLSKDQHQVADLITNLETDQRMGEMARQEAEGLRRELGVLKRSLEEKEAQLHNREQEIILQAQAEAARILRKTREEADALLRGLKGDIAAESQKAQEKLVAKAREQLREKASAMSAELPEKKYPGLVPQNVQPGQYVDIPKLKQKGHVLSKANHDGEVYVQAGIMKIQVPLSDLRLLEEPEAAGGQTKLGQVRLEKIRSVSVELDLRGKRVDEAVDETAKYLDDAMIAGLKEVRIIHGKGTGVLREVITDLLKTHPAVIQYHLGALNEGGSGVTVASLDV